MPQTLRSIKHQKVVENQRTLELGHLHASAQWTINGLAGTAQNSIMYKPQRGTTEKWTIVNKSGNFSHPMHIHLVDLQIKARSGGVRGVEPYEAVAMKDVVWIRPNETVEVLARYAPWDGVYMFHCHNLIHEVRSPCLAAFRPNTPA